MKTKANKTEITRGKHAAAFKKGVRIIVHGKKGDEVRKLKRNADGSFIWTPVGGKATR